MSQRNTISITMDDGEVVEFYVLEQTTLMNNNYYLVVPVDEQEEEECYILKETSQDETGEYGVYEFVDDDKELESLFPIFEELMEDSDMEVEF